MNTSRLTGGTCSRPGKCFSEKKMREKVECAVLRSLKNFEEDFQRGSFAIRTENHTANMTGEQPRGEVWAGGGWLNI